MSIILAKVFGLYFFALGLAFLINPDRLKIMCRRAIKDDNFLFLGSIIALLIGSFIVGVHNLWVVKWPIILTLLGWWSVLKGFFLLAYPDTVRFFSFVQERSILFYRLLSIIYLVLGLFFLYQGLM